MYFAQLQGCDVNPWNTWPIEKAQFPKFKKFQNWTDFGDAYYKYKQLRVAFVQQRVDKVISALKKGGDLQKLITKEIREQYSPKEYFYSLS